MYTLFLLFLGSFVFGKIPKRIIQTGPNEENAEFKGIHGSLQLKNKDFAYEFYNDNRMFEFMREQFPNTELLEVFLDERVPTVMKTDLFRLAAISTLGGFYMDMDVLGHKSMEPLLKDTAVFPKEWQRNDEQFEARHGSLPEDEEDRWQMGNYAFGAEAEHPLLQAALDEAVRRTKKLLETERELADEDVLKSTGPYMLSDVYHKGRKDGKFQDVNFLEGGDEKPLFPHSHGSHKWHKFGSYGEHVITHTWVRRRLATEEELAEILWQNSLKEDQDMAWAKGVIQELKTRFGELTISESNSEYADVYEASDESTTEEPQTTEGAPEEPEKKKDGAPTEAQTASSDSHPNWKRKSNVDSNKLIQAEMEAKKLARVEGLDHKKVRDEELEWAVGVLKRHFVRSSDRGLEIAVGDTYYDGLSDTTSLTTEEPEEPEKKNDGEKEDQLGKTTVSDASKNTSGPQEDIPLSTRVFIFAGILLSVSVLVYVWNSKPSMADERTHLLDGYDGETVEARTA